MDILLITIVMLIFIYDTYDNVSVHGKYAGLGQIMIMVLAHNDYKLSRYSKYAGLSIVLINVLAWRRYFSCLIS